MAKELPKDISIVFEKNKDSKTFPVTGAWGGINPDTLSLTVHLYNEYTSLPNSIKAEVNDEGKVDVNAGQRISRGDITREVQGTMVLSPEHALSLANWLTNKAREALEKKR
ncbi:MAG: hypothetical protein WD016_13980 [Balneolaceae bacterium]